ncbi:MAG: EamA family transporter [Paracoccaceae bacterium]
MPLWIPLTICAAFLQNLRTALQKAIKGRLTTAGAAYARFFYAWPLGLLYLWGLLEFGGYTLPPMNAEFLLFCLLGSISQILFTVVLLWLFSFRSFAVGTTFSKLEVVLIAAIGALLLGDTITALAVLAVAVGAAGTIILAMQETRLSLGGLVRGLREKATAVGLLSAALLGASVVFFRAAGLSLDAPVVLAAGYALAVSLVMQTVMMGVWFLVFDPGELRAVIREWRRAGPVGVIGMMGSVCWFTAFTLQNAAYVRALGQVELIFTFVISVFYFKETISRTEIAGILLILVAILLILLAA